VSRIVWTVAEGGWTLAAELCEDDEVRATLTQPNELDYGPVTISPHPDGAGVLDMLASLWRKQHYRASLRGLPTIAPLPGGPAVTWHVDANGVNRCKEAS
jgi:hypothetical protein